MMMTEEAYKKWLLDPQTPLDILDMVLKEHKMLDWPLPTYLLEDLGDLARTDRLAQSAIDEARIPLMNWFRQQREAEQDRRAGISIEPSTEDVLGPL